MPHPTRLSKAHMAQLKAGIDRRVAGVKSKIDNAMDTIESRAEKVKVLRHGMLRRQLSFFSVPPEDREDPIPHTNVFLGVLYVLGAVAALCFALIDSSCEEVTAYREDAPIDTCTEMLASFSCRTADYNRTAGTGFSKIFDKTTCLEGRNATEEKFGHHPVGLCGSMKEGVFTCQTSEYDNTGVPKIRTAYENWDKIENGFRRTFERDVCPSEVPHAAVSWVYAAHPANTSNLFSDTKFRCETADFVAGPETEGAGDKGYAYVYDSGRGPLEHDSTQMMKVTETYPAEECGSAIPDIDGNDKFTCRTSDYDEDAGTGLQGTYSTTYVPDMPDLRCPQSEWDSNTSKSLPGLAYEDILGVHPAAALLNFKVGTDYTCQTADYDEAAGSGSKTGTCTYSGEGYSVSSVSSVSCPRVSYRTLADGSRQVDEVTYYGAVTRDWNVSGCTYDGPSNGNFTCQTADYNATTGSGTQKNFSQTDLTCPDSNGHHYKYPNVTFATCRYLKTVYGLKLDTCKGTLHKPVARLDTCTGRRRASVKFDKCWGTREMSVEFATCEGTQDVPVTCKFSRPLPLQRDADQPHTSLVPPPPQMNCAADSSMFARPRRRPCASPRPWRMPPRGWECSPPRTTFSAQGRWTRRRTDSTDAARRMTTRE